MPTKPKSKATRSRGGRPPYSPTIESRQMVEEMKFCGESENTIARALRIDVDTMRKHFADELAYGHASRRREIVSLLFKSARDGNVSAQKKLEEMGRVAGAAAEIDRRGQAPTPPAPPKLGKKEQQLVDAKEVTGKFAPPAPPKLIVNNG
jgi:hypothetical protein